MEFIARSNRHVTPLAQEPDGGYARYCKPGLVDRLRAIRLDITYERAEGDYLWYRHEGTLRRVLDLVGGYGANLFGHHHPDLVAVARDQLDAQVPVFAQASCRTGAGRLAEALCERLGDYLVTFVNSGAEAIEAALKHAFLERPRPMYWAVRGGFHGKTLGAVQFTWSQRDMFPGMGPRVRYLDPDDPADWEAARAEVSEVAAAVFEPIAGEGGVRPRPAAFVKWLARTCREAGIPLIADEIQTGMGRTGTFLACESLGLDPDYVCLGKALGGGLAKVGAMLVRRDRAVEAFSMLHSSTFAEDDPGCLIGLEALRVMDRDGLPARCTALGNFLRKELESLHVRYPGQIQEVRGLGLMVGVELRPQPEAASHVIRTASDQNLLGYFAAAYLLHAHGIRVMPTLSQPLTLRVQPSAYITEAELSRFVGAVDGLCRLLRAGDAGRLLDFSQPPGRAGGFAVPTPLRREPARTPRRVAFLTHLLSDQQLADLDPSLARLPAAEMAAFLDRTARVWEPLVLDQTHVHSPTGADVHLSVLGLGITARQIIRAMQARDVKWIMGKLEAAVALAVERECQVVGFGGFTSIVAHNCKRITTPGAALTTGNSLTVGMGLRAIEQAAREIGIDLRKARLAVVGASGNIASTYAQMVAPLVGEVVLVGRDRASPRLAAVAAEINRTAPRTRCILADDCSALIGCDLVVSASNTPEPIIFPPHLGTDPVVICDISLPPDVSEDVLRERPDVRVIRGGVVRLPLDPGFSIAGIGLPPGHSLACMAETLLMGLEEATDNWSVGPVTADGVRRAMAAADAHGFDVADMGLLSTGPVGRFFDELRGRPREPTPTASMVLAAAEAPA
jgi:acetylornithine/succinyldiaminopimelate/putrescine aminotransferase